MMDALPSPMLKRMDTIRQDWRWARRAVAKLLRQIARRIAEGRALW